MSTIYKSPEELFGYSDVANQVAAIEEAWGLKPRHRRSAARTVALKVAIDKRKKIETLPTLAPAWTPCKHWGGVHECPCCKSKVQAGYMKRAQAMYEEHAEFVRKRVTAEMRLANRAQDIRDVVQKVWEKIAVRINRFEVKGTTKIIRERNTKAWLKDVAHSVTMDYLDTIFSAKKRDVRQEVPLVETDKGTPDAWEVADGVLYPREMTDPACNLPAKPTPTADDKNDPKEDSTEYLRSISTVLPKKLLI